VESLVSDEDGVLTELETTVNVNSATVKEVEYLGYNEGVDKAEANEGGVTKEGGADRGSVRILNIP